MQSRDFAYWLQGFFELTDAITLTEHQVDLIKRHLNMVFIHEIDPGFPAHQQAALTEAHETPLRSTENGSQAPSGVVVPPAAPAPEKEEVTEESSQDPYRRALDQVLEESREREKRRIRRGYGSGYEDVMIKC